VGVEYRRFVKRVQDQATLEELALVDALAQHLLDHLQDQAAVIDELHVHGAQSSSIQDVVGALLTQELSFASEVVITPSEGFVTRARPDFFYRLDSGRGVLAEVERGGTVNNNHDLKDVWKAHIAPDAQHLFLVVPNSNWSADGRAREKPFPRVAARLSSFFGDPRREIDVVSIHLFGYGKVGDE
jgi:hypothetical protein